jgi:hypothetical protein
MTRPTALTSFASFALVCVATACHPVDLGGDGNGGDRAAGGAAPGSGGGAEAQGGGPSANGGGQPGSGGSRMSGTGGDVSTSSGSGGQMGSGGGAAAACPTSVSGALKTYAHAPYAPSGLAVDAAAIYWTATNQGLAAGAVLRTDLATGVTTELASAALDPSLPGDSFDYPGGIARSQGDVIWTAGAGAEVVKVPAAGGAATTLYHDASGFHVPGTGSTPHTFVIDATNVYWNEATRAGNLMTNLLLAAPLAGGGAITTMASNTVDVTDPNAPPSLPLSLRVDGATAFYTLWAGATTMSVTRRVGIDGQNSVDLLQAGFLLAPDGTNLYNAFETLVVRQSESGGADAMVLAPAGANIFETYQSIVAFGNDLYLTSFGGYFDGQSWTQEDCGWVKKVSKSGGPATVLWAGTGRPFDLAVDASAVTWTDIDNDNVVRLVP